MTTSHATDLLPCDGCAELAPPAPRVLLRHLDGTYCQPCAVEIISDCAGGTEFLADLGLACDHPPARLRSWMATSEVYGAPDVQCVACCECGAVLAGGAK